MSYNRWMPVQCSSELYHHGVKGMKWGKHLFGKGVDIQAGAGGGGGSNEEDLELLEKLKELYGEKAYEKFLEAKQKRADAVAFNKETQQMVKDTRDEDALHRANVKFLSKRHKEYNEAKEAYEKTPKAKVEKAKNAITHPGETASKYSGAKSESDEEYASRSAKETAEKTKEYIKEHSVAGAIGKAKKKLDGVTREKRIPEKKIAEETIREQRIPEKKIAETVIKEKKVGAGTKGKSFYEQNKDKMRYKVGDMDTDARTRRYLAEGRDRYRQNGKYRNMNLTDVYGENSKVNNHVGKNGANLYKQMDVSDNRNGMNYATREQDKSKYNDGKYGFKDRVREKITGKMDPDYKKDAYNKKVSAAVRVANQKQAWSVGMEEADIRDKAKNYVDRLEKQVYNKSLAGAIERRRKKKRR